MVDRVRIILQARTSSNRLPAKALLPIGGMPLVVLCALRLSSTGHEVVLATSNEVSDDLLALTAEKYGVKVYRGSLFNVFNRFLQCSLDLDDNDIIVRATADNPLPNGEFIDSIIKMFNEQEEDYLGTSSPYDGLPYGLSAEVFLVGALRKVAENKINTFDSEHVTDSLRKSAGSAGIISRGKLITEDVSHLRATIDTLEDYLAMAPLLNEVKEPVKTAWEVLVPRLPEGESSFDQVLAKNPAADTIHSMITLGTAQLGMEYGIANKTGSPGDDETTEILALAIKSGITHIDTARAYGNSESRIGKTLFRLNSPSIKIITKLRPFDDLPDDASVREVRRAVDASVYGSCHALKRSKLDILMFHRSADIFRWQGAAIERLDELVSEGVINELGVSVYKPDEAVKCISDIRIKHVQAPFNLLDFRWLSDEFEEAIINRPDVKVHVRSVFLQGLLISDDDTWPDWFDSRCEIIDRIISLVKKLKRKDRIDLCIAYVRSISWVSSLVLGVETLKQFEELLTYADEPKLTDEQVKLVQTIFSDIPSRILIPSEW